MNPSGQNTRESFQGHIQAYVDRKGLLTPGETVIVAVSGGMDSVVLLDVLRSLAADRDLQIHVAHLNHGLRSEDSDSDENFVEHLAQDLGLPFHTRRTDCGEIADRTRRSVEVAARDERRAFLGAVATEIGATKIATGHHSDDQAETMLLRLLRGTGTTGLGGIRSRKDSAWIRPFLTVTRDEIEAYADRSGLDWRIDSTNFNVDIPRNRVRHQLLPVLRSDYGPHVAEVLSRTAEIVESDDDLLESITLDASKTVICAHSHRKIALDEACFFGYHVAVQRRLIRGLLTRLGLDPRKIEFRLIDRLLTRFGRGPGTMEVSPNMTACSTGRLILLGTNAPCFEEQIEPGPNRIESIDAELRVDNVSRPDFPENLAETSPYELWFDRWCLPQDLILRKARPGDRIRPFGSAGSTKVSDVLIDRKVPCLIRDEIPVLADRDEVLWIVGIRASEKSRILESSNQAVRFQFSGCWRQFYSAMQRYT